MKLFLLSLIFVNSVFIESVFSQSFKVPPLRAPVNDYAGVIDVNIKAQINYVLQVLNKKTQTQIAVLIVNSLKGEPIETVSIQVADQWKLGKSASDKGVLLLISIKDKKFRIEVGQGLEGRLPDAYAKQILDNDMQPLFKQGKVSEGVLFGVYKIITRTNPEFPVKNYFSKKISRKSSRVSKQNTGISIFKLIIMGIVFLMVITGRGGPLLTILLLSSMGGGRGGRYGGGGGFSGGGGGFSGGGASGGW